MATISFEQLSGWIEGYARHVAGTGEYQARDVISGPGMKQIAFTAPGRHAVFSLHAADGVVGFINIVGGGAMGAEPSDGLAQTLLEVHRHLDWGSPFATRASDGKVTFGSKLTLPLSIFNAEGFGEGSGFRLSMIDVVADNGRLLADQVVPVYGGERFDEHPDRSHLLVGAVMAP